MKKLRLRRCGRCGGLRQLEFRKFCFQTIKSQLRFTDLLFDAIDFGFSRSVVDVVGLGEIVVLFE